ncbi:DUF397 domain-containing protein [Streptomyces sp. NPDC048416]|uniref:DUF397 domain-containing protein n=1 Tax=Streptomyces sp. NPDC048416 TaxID=3365546 RepID=UPI00371B1EF5
MSETLSWHKSTYSGGGGGNDCVECVTDEPMVYVRDTKDHGRGVITVDPGAWAKFAAHVAR